MWQVIVIAIDYICAVIAQCLIPTHCACGKTNSVGHRLICKLCSYTSMRHNSVRDWGTDNRKGL